MRKTMLLGLIFAFHADATAQPVLAVNASSGWPTVGWSVYLLVDTSEVVPGGFGTISTEIGFEFAPTVTISNVRLNEVFTLDEVPAGHNPFDEEATSGLFVGDDNIFVAATAEYSVFFSYRPLLSFTTSESAELTWGGQTILAGTSAEFIGARIIQDGVVFDGYVGSKQGFIAPILDPNYDGTVNGDDIPVFVTALLDLSDWQAEYPDLDPLFYLDANLDGFINNDDIPSFAAALLNPPFITQSTAVPESGSAVLLCLATAAVFCINQSRRRVC